MRLPVRRAHDKNRPEPPTPADEKEVCCTGSPEDDVQCESEKHDKNAERLGATGGVHFDDSLVFQRDRFTAEEMVEQREQGADDHDGDEADSHAVQESHIRIGKFQDAVLNDVDSDAEPAKITRAFGDEEAEYKYRQSSRTQEALEFLDVAEDAVQLVRQEDGEPMRTSSRWEADLRSLL